MGWAGILNYAMHTSMHVLYNIAQCPGPPFPSSSIINTLAHSEINKNSKFPYYVEESGEMYRIITACKLHVVIGELRSFLAILSYASIVQNPPLLFRE